MNRSDENLLTRWRSALDADVENLDARTVARLVQIRHQAMSRRSARQSFRPRFAPAVAFATSALVLATLLRISDGSIPVFDADAILLEIVLAEDELELIEDLEFYRWLDANGNAG